MQQTIVYSNGQAAEIQGGTLTRLSLQASLGSQTPDFPLPFLLSALNDPEISLQYVGLEALNDVAVHHVRVWNTFSSTPALQPLANFTLADLWVDPSSNLPLRISYGRRDAEGATPTLRVDLSFSGYSNVGGVLYPFKIQKALNGSPWGTVTIQKVVLNIGLMDSDFAVQ